MLHVKRVASRSQRVVWLRRIKASLAGPSRGMEAAGASLLFLLLAWPVAGTSPYVDVDASWGFGLVAAAQQGLGHGSDILFAYGPLGFLAVEPLLWSRWAAASQLTYTAVIFATFYGTAFLLFRRASLSRGWSAAGVLLLASLAVSRPSTQILTLTTLALVVMLLRDPQTSVRTQRWVLGVGVVVAAAQSLTKINEGVECSALLFAAVFGISTRPYRHLTQVAASLLAVALVLWSAAGQSVRDVVPWVIGSLHTAAGYTEAQAYEMEGRGLDYLWAVLILSGTARLLLGVLRNMPGPDARRRRSALIFVVLLATYLSLKHGFVRHDGHAVGFFLTASVLAIALSPSLRERRSTATHGFATAVALVALTIFAGLRVNSLPVPPPLLTNALSSPALALGHMLDVLAPDRSRTVQRAARAQMREQLQLPPGILAMLGDGSVHVEPYETAVVWAYGLNWDPVPVFQTYAAYSPFLDALNAEAFASEDAPDFVLRQRKGSIDGRLIGMEAPKHLLGLLCHYREVAIEEQWQLLERTQNRCGPVRAVGSATIAEDQIVALPPATQADRILLGELQLPHSLGGAIWSAIFKPLHPQLVDAGDNGPQRLVRANAEGPLVLRVPPFAPSGPGTGGPLTYSQLHLPGAGGDAKVTYYEVDYRP